MTEFDFNYKRKKLTLRKAKYDNERIAIVIVDAGTGKRWGVLTCNIPEVDVPSGKFPIKTWSENKDIAEVIYNTCIFNDTQVRAKNNNVTVEFWEFNDPSALDNMPKLPKL